MKEIHSIVVRFPQREFEIRKRCAEDAHFKSVCEDYGEAAIALRYWQAASTTGNDKVAEYVNFVGELEAEILTLLDRPGTPSRHP
ncbi:hypothetical protein GR183_08290 [Stappia sp. GBMRC 2046]|uniref:Uncharacterized protein n=1 Tax=Stappia sediminis TaxID=2692190 RepID=A0A7X3S7N1_9HYPH|nr:hypothetical protein [Stappia sediminis]MXN64904.1 hypothetical protein [Stappia sediminis]